MRFAVVWVNVNRDEPREKFENYYRDMPWFAVPYENFAHVLSITADKFNLVGIPHLVILDGLDASVVTLDGRSKVTDDIYGLEFPWRKRSLLMFTPRKFQMWARDMALKIKAATQPSSVARLIKRGIIFTSAKAYGALLYFLKVVFVFFTRQPQA